MSALDLHVELRPQQDDQYELKLAFNNEFVPAVASPAVTHMGQIQFDWESAYRYAGEVVKMGSWLGQLIFGADPAQRLLEQALASASELETSVRCRLTLPPDLQSLPWETMTVAGVGFLAASERVLFSRFLPVDNYQPAARLRREALGVSLAVAAPEGLKSYNLARPDAAGFANNLRDAVGEDQLRLVPATRRSLLRTVRDGAGILCLAAHGVFPRGSRDPYILLAGEQGDVARLPVADLAADLASVARLPRLIVLLSCNSAGSDALLGSPDEALLSLGAQLVVHGAPAVIAIRGTISFETAGEFLTAFFAELQRDWVIDRALGAARRNILNRYDAWAPVLFMRLADGWLAHPTSLQAAFAPPPLPPDYVHRPAAHEAVVERLLEGIESDEPHTVGITATGLIGAGGFGKTTLAQAICKDPRLADAFPDGIFWLTLGESPGSILSLVNKLTTYLSGSLAKATNLEDAQQALNASAATQHLLIILDDIWQADHARPFLINQTDCVILLTTRNSKTLPNNAARVAVESMARAESVALVSQGTAGSSDLAWDNVARRLGDWPLLLKLANSALRDRLQQGLTPEQAVADLLQTYDSLGITGFDAQDNEERQTAVRRTLALSIDRLQPEATYGQHVVDEASRFRELGVFPEDVDIPVQTLAVYWRQFGFDEVMVRQLCQRLFDLSLLLQFDRQGDTIRLHDVIRKYLAENRPAKELHRRLVNSYRELSEPEWQTFPDHPYMAEYAPYHIRAADSQDDMRQLLLSFAWMQRKLEATYTIGLLADYYEYGDANQPAIRHVSEALRLASGLISDDNELSGQLYGRLVGSKLSQIKSLIRQIECQKKSPWLRPCLPVQGRPGGALLRTLPRMFGDDPVVTVNRSGTLAAVGSGSRVSVWDLIDGKRLHLWVGAHADQVTAICFAPGDKFLVTAGGRRSAMGLSVRPRKSLRRQLESSRTGTRIDEMMKQIYPPQNHVKIWSLTDGTVAHTLEGHEDTVTCVAASLDARVVVSGSTDLTVRVWDGRFGTLRQANTDHEDTILTVGVSQDGESILSVALDEFVQLREGHLKKVGRFRLRSHYNIHGGTYDVAVNADQGVIVSMITDIIRIWNVADADGVMRSDNPRYWMDRDTLGADGIIRSPGTRYNWFGQIAISAAGDTIVSTIGPEILVWDRDRQKLRHRMLQRGERITALAVDAAAKIAITASEDKGVAVWDISKPVGEKKKRNLGSITALATSSQSRFIAAGTESGTVYLMKRDNGRISTILQQANRIGMAIREYLDSYNNRLSYWFNEITEMLLEFVISRLVPADSTRDDDEELNALRALWNRFVPGILRKPLEHQVDRIDEYLTVAAVSMSTDGKQIAVGFDNGLVKVWRKRLLGGWKLQARWRAASDEDKIEQIAVAEDNILLTAVEFDGVAMWDARAGRLLTHVEAEEIYFLRGEHLQVLIAVDKRSSRIGPNRENELHLRLVDLRSGETVHKVTCAALQAVALDRSGLVFALADDNKNYWWDLNTGRQRVVGLAEMWDEFADEDTLILDNKQFLFSSRLGSLEMVDLNKAEEVATWTPLNKITAYTVDWKNKQIIFGSASGDIQVLELMNAPQK